MKEKGFRFSHKLPVKIGNYIVTEIISTEKVKEVFLAQDLACDRNVVLKRIIVSNLDKKERDIFLSEVQVVSKLSHPSVIPIYSIYEFDEEVFYTTPCIEGKSLIDILIESKKDKNLSKELSIRSMMIIFLNICQAIHYSHSAGYLHRDINPQNIICNGCEQVMVVDWSLAIPIHKEDYSSMDIDFLLNFKYKTLNYKAPESIIKNRYTVKSDIYSLGSILYLMLTLDEPFNRKKDILECKKDLIKSNSPFKIPTIELSKREIPTRLSKVVYKCLSNPNMRYNSVHEIIREIEDYIRGKPEWSTFGKLDIENSNDWKFQENISLKHETSISRYREILELVMFMISKDYYFGNIRLKFSLTFKSGCNGIGVFISVPEKNRSEVENGYCIWIGSKNNKGCKLLYSNVVLVNKHREYLKPNKTYEIIVQREENRFDFYINDHLSISYKIPILSVGGHIGIMMKDVFFDITPISLDMSSQYINVNCLSIPDAFLMIKDYSKAISEYRRIVKSFSGRIESVEATFRAGIALIMMGENATEKRKYCFNLALNEFSKLHKTLGSPLEYLGKSLVYYKEGDVKEEIKCLEFSLRMYRRHFLLYRVKEHIIFRLYESVVKNRLSAYSFALLTMKSIPSSYKKKEVKDLIDILMDQLEDIPFIETRIDKNDEFIKMKEIVIKLSFWLSNPVSLYELVKDVYIEEEPDNIWLLENIFLSMIAIGYENLVRFILDEKLKDLKNPKFLGLKKTIKILIGDISIKNKIKILQKKFDIKFIIPLLKQNLTREKSAKLLSACDNLRIPNDLYIWILLLNGKIKRAKNLLEKEDSKNVGSIFYMLNGCCLSHIKGEEFGEKYFCDTIDMNLPMIPNLLGQFLKKTKNTKVNWVNKMFLWEKMELYRQLILYYTCIGNKKKAKYYEVVMEREFVNSQITLNFINHTESICL